jgi:hypothetical protein
VTPDGIAGSTILYSGDFDFEASALDATIAVVTMSEGMSGRLYFPANASTTAFSSAVPWRPRAMSLPSGPIRHVASGCSAR